MDVSYDIRLKQVMDLFADDPLYQVCAKPDTLSEWRLFRKYSKKILDTEWLDVIEDALPNLDVIVRNPRRFIVVEEDLVDTSRARSVSEESVKHLATHTNFIHGFDKERDMVLPSKLLNSTKEESFEVYENRFIYTLLKRLQQFVKTRYDAVVALSSNDDHLKVVVDKGVKFTEANVALRLDSVIKMPYERAVNLSAEENAPVARLVKIYNVVMGFMTTPFAKEMVSCAPVRPPIQRTNVILKNNDFKKALALWEFLQGYDKQGYEVKPITQVQDMDDALKSQYTLLVFLNSIFAQKLVGVDFNSSKLEGETVGDNGGTDGLNLNPEDYPESEIPLQEVKFLSIPSMYGGQKLDEVDRVEINYAMDRVFAQYKINTAKDNTREKAKRIVAQRKAEEAYKNKILKLRKKERELILKMEKRAEEERQRHLADIADITVEKVTKEQLKKLEDDTQTAFRLDIESEQTRLTEKALAKMRAEVADGLKPEIDTHIEKQTADVNALRRKLKASINVKIDEEIDKLIAKIPSFFDKDL